MKDAGLSNPSLTGIAETIAGMVAVPSAVAPAAAAPKPAAASFSDLKR